MRPERLELSGFTAFRERTVLDVSNLDLFALTGPTGSGKTSLIDALCFALYGSVPRLDRRTVEPVISLGLTEARVSLTFTVDGVRYTAARVVRKRGSGATTPEARLEGGPETVIGAAQVTEAVIGLLGLGFDQFTKSVVLPQGEFAAFLHDEPSRRQDLLKRLLDLEVYGRMREAAGKRKDRAAAAADVLEGQLADLADATAEAEDEAAARVAELVSLVGAVEEASAELAAAGEELDRRARRVTELAGRIGALRALSVPAGIDELGAARVAAAAELDARTLEDARSREECAAVEAELAGLPEEADLRETVARWGRYAEGIARREDLVAERTRAAAGAEEAAAVLDEARRRRAGVEEELRRLEREHDAHRLRTVLVPGEPCPVCLQPVAEVPSGAPPEGLEAAEAGVAAARRREEEAVGAHAAAVGSAEVAGERLARFEEALAAEAASLAGLRSAAAAEEALLRVADVRRRVDLARSAERESRRRLDAARDAFDRARAEEDAARAGFDAARDSVASLGPPPAERTDLAADWGRLVAWAGETASGLETEASVESADFDAARADVDGRRARLDGLLSAHGVPSREGRWRDAAVEELAAARVRLDAVRARREKAGELTEGARRRREEAEVAKSLAQHLRADGFEGWLLEEAQAALVAGANDLLAELSGGAYSLEYDKDRRDIRVVDHRNAGERRSVRTLSGGETFLVSLSLALALGEQMATLSAAGSSRLESLFLDEGFGTLDADSLDTVAAVIADLGARGRMVGIVTHVTELAEMVPVRFEVRRGPGGSTISRVEN